MLRAVSPTTTGTTQSRSDNSSNLATTQFVNQQISGAEATIPASTTGGIYNQASLGTGLQIVIFVSGGVVSSILSVVTGGTGFAVGDVLVLPAGNSDAIVRITNVVGGVVQSGGVSVVYGGSGYTTGATVAAVPVPPSQRTIIFSGVLASNLTLIVQNGTALTASRRFEVVNNTTGAFTTTVFLSNGAGGTTGNGVVVPQGTNASTAMQLFTDGVTDVWPAVTAGGLRGTVAADNATTGSVGEYATANTAGTSLTSNTFANGTQISLTAGDWDVSAMCQFNPAAGTTISNITVGLSTTSATLGALGSTTVINANFGTGSAQQINTPVVRFSLASTTTIFVPVASVFGVSTMTATALIRARRAR